MASIATEVPTEQIAQCFRSGNPIYITVQNSKPLTNKTEIVLKINTKTISIFILKLIYLKIKRIKSR